MLYSIDSKVFHAHEGGCCAIYRGGGGGQASDTSYVAYFDILLVHNECGWRVEWVWRVGWVRSKLLH